MSSPLDSTTDQAARRTAAEYDRIPYRSLPYPLTRPAHIAAIAQTFGLAVPAVTTARVLEIGCAGGGNIIPLAAAFPAGMLQLSTVPVHAGRADATHPLGWTLARADTSRGATETVSLYHVPVPLDGPSRTLLPLLDGTRDPAALVQCVLELMNQGSIVLQHDGEAVADPEVTRKAVTELVDSTIARLASNALLSA